MTEAELARGVVAQVERIVLSVLRWTSGHAAARADGPAGTGRPRARPEHAPPAAARGPPVSGRASGWRGRWGPPRGACGACPARRSTTSRSSPCRRSARCSPRAPARCPSGSCSPCRTPGPAVARAVYALLVGGLVGRRARRRRPGPRPPAPTFDPDRRPPPRDARGGRAGGTGPAREGLPPARDRGAPRGPGPRTPRPGASSGCWR